ncbi:hypothetical protein JTE90_022095, partial [Oedothorax gibbosus]
DKKKASSSSSKMAYPAQPAYDQQPSQPCFGYPPNPSSLTTRSPLSPGTPRNLGTSQACRP